jgi:PHD/YefM family antitoxin component YafN of YafNO toxin-antitoxin module
LQTLTFKNVFHQKYVQYIACIALCFSFDAFSGGKNVIVTQKPIPTAVADSDEQMEAMEQTLELNFSPEHRERLRKALDDYARSVDQDHEQIEARRRAMRESLRERFFDADRDFDNTIDRQEATEKLPQIARHFNSVDENQDGLISLEELEGAQMRIDARRRAAEASMDLQKSLESDTFANTNVSKQQRKNKQAASNSRKQPL